MKSRREKIIMIAIITVLGVMCVWLGMSMSENDGFSRIGAEVRMSEREKCYKPAELRSIGTLPKFTVADRFVQGILRQGICGIDKHGGKKELNGFNDTRRYALKYAEN